MVRRSILTRADYEDYLIRLYFGPSNDCLQCCLDRAYRDFNRTMHGLRMIETGSALYSEALDHLRQAIESLIATEVVTQDVFDRWHEEVCNTLAEIYSQHHHRMFIGQAQKWINMTFKYAFTFGENRLPGFSKLYSCCHVPLDNIFIGYLEPYHPPKLSVRWSRLTDYQEYLNFQKWVRERFADIPLDTEFLIWLGKRPSPS